MTRTPSTTAARAASSAPTRSAIAAATLLAALAVVALGHQTPARAQGMGYGYGQSGQPMQMQQPQMQQPQTQQPQMQQQPGQGGGAQGEQQSQWERRDLGVAPTQALHDGGMHGPTPNQIPGGQLITTKGLLPLLQQGMQVVVIDVLGGNEMLPNAIQAAWASQPGTYDDQTQQQFAQMLRQVTRGQADTPLVFYCLSAECWMSYNASLRAIRAGYRNVLWYRGGIEAWRTAGLPTQPAGQMQQSRGQSPSGPMAGGTMAGGPMGGAPMSGQPGGQMPGGQPYPR